MGVRKHRRNPRHAQPGLPPARAREHAQPRRREPPLRRAPHPELRVRQVQSDRESKGILRRLSHNTIDTLSGTVAKLAHSNPCIFFTNAVNQIMAYDNLAGVVIQALNYVTILGFDVLVYVILDALANPNKERVKDDGVNISDWLQSKSSLRVLRYGLRYV